MAGKRVSTRGKLLHTWTVTKQYNLLLIKGGDAPLCEKVSTGLVENNGNLLLMD